MREGGCWPAPFWGGDRIRVGGFADCEVGAGLEKAGGALCGDGGGAEASGYDEGELGAEVGIAGGVFSSGVDRSEAVSETKRLERFGQELGSAVSALEENAGRRRPGQCEDKAGDAAARSEVEHGACGWVEQVGHALGMAHVILDRSGAEETLPARLFEDR